LSVYEISVSGRLKVISYSLILTTRMSNQMVNDEVMEFALRSRKVFIKIKHLKQSSNTKQINLVINFNEDKFSRTRRLIEQ
jgi:hypothetical protein